MKNNWERIKKSIADPDQITIFSQSFYPHFDRTLARYTLKFIYQSGSDVCLFFPAEIISASMILLANIKCLRRDDLRNDIKEQSNLQDFLGLSFEFHKESIIAQEDKFKSLDHTVWLESVLSQLK